MNINPMVSIPAPQPIKRFKDLFIDCDENWARSFFDTIVQYVRDNHADTWKVDDHGMSMLAGPVFEKGLFCCIILQNDNREPYADVTIKYDHDDKRIWLCNIVPCDTDQLSIDEYNAALDKFHNELVRQFLKGKICTITKDSFIGAEAMSKESWKKLESFNFLANRSSLHPLDNQRWHQFVISAYHNDPKLDADTVGKILHNELGWSSEKTFQLTVRYEDEIALLREFNKINNE